MAEKKPNPKKELAAMQARYDYLNAHLSELVAQGQNPQKLMSELYMLKQRIEQLIINNLIVGDK